MEWAQLGEIFHNRKCTEWCNIETQTRRFKPGVCGITHSFSPSIRGSIRLDVLEPCEKLCCVFWSDKAISADEWDRQWNRSSDVSLDGYPIIWLPLFAAHVKGLCCVDSHCSCPLCQHPLLIFICCLCIINCPKKLYQTKCNVAAC